jgi:gluconate 5-dehydrogenase/3-oxoacyl-[acyl-carrier protein] reductase
MSTDFGGRTALITGAGRGIGAAISMGLARAGADVILLARTAAQLEETAGAVRAATGVAVRTLVADIADDAARDRALEALLDAGAIDILVNNAASVEPLGPTVALSPEQVRQALAINLVAPIAVSARLAPGMVDRGWGRIVNVSSGVVARPASMIGGNVYATTKAGLEAHTRNLAGELEGTGVTVNVYRPGGVDTAMQEWIRSQDPARIGTALHGRFVDWHEAGGLISPEESADALLAHLLSPDGDETGAIWNLRETISG